MRCLVRFLDDWPDFRCAELHALMQLNGLPGLAPELMHCKDLYLIIELPSIEIAQRICQRSVLIWGIFHLWGHGNTLEETVNDAIQSAPLYLESLYGEDHTWCINIDTYCKTITWKEKEAIRQQFQFLRFRGKVDISNATVESWVLLDFSKFKDDEIPACPPVPSFFGRIIAKNGMKDALKKYDLKKRNYIGPTSLDHYLAFIMGNLAHVRPKESAFDPFVGTGSILVALAHTGANCYGCDIDIRVLRGEMHAGINQSKDVKRGIFENFKSYNLPNPELIRMDNHLIDRHLHLNTASNPADGIFDAIVTDPPYGIRAGAKKTGKKDPLSYSISAEDRESHVPSVQNYPVQEVMLDLLHSAARTLVVGGRLAYLIPTSYDFTVQDLPVHPCLRIIALCEQPLSTRHGRHCVVMEKVCKYSAEFEQQYVDYKLRIMNGNDNGFGMQMSKLEAALAADPLDDSDVVKRMSNSTKKRKTKRERSTYGLEPKEEVNNDAVAKDEQKL